MSETVLNSRRAAAWLFPRLGPPARKALVRCWPAVKWLYRASAVIAACWFGLIFLVCLLAEKGFLLAATESFVASRTLARMTADALWTAFRVVGVLVSRQPPAVGVLASVFLGSLIVYAGVLVSRSERT
jgi:hypothetical protein